jgi:hypothetical protein
MNPITFVSTTALGLGALFMLAPPPSHAQTPSEFTVIASGLNAPRGLRFGPDGDLYVAEGGKGGKNATTAAQCMQVPGPVGPYFGGDTGAIVKIDKSGKKTVVASGFPSTAASTGDLSSVADVVFVGNDLYALIAGGGCSHGNPSSPNGIAKVNLANGKWSLISDLSEYAMTHPGKYDDADDFEPDGVWYHMIEWGGNIIAVEPNRGILVKVATNGRASEFIDISASQGHIVPTAMAKYQDQIYVGNLLYFPILQQWSRILRIAPAGSIGENDVAGFTSTPGEYVAESKAGFTSIVAAAVGPDNLLYVLELSDNAGYPALGNGKVVRIEHSGAITEVITGLNVPGGMAWGPDGRLYISDFSAVPAPNYGLGRILRFDVAFGY